MTAMQSALAIRSGRMPCPDWVMASKTVVARRMRAAVPSAARAERAVVVARKRKNYVFRIGIELSQVKSSPRPFLSESWPRAGTFLKPLGYCGRVSCWYQRSLLRDLAILGLANSHQAPGALLHLIGELIQILRGGADVLNRFADVVIVRAHHVLDAAHEALRLLHGGLELSKVFL